MISKELKKEKQVFAKKDKGVTINPNMRDYSNDPFFIRQADKAKETIDKYGLPKF